MKKWIKLTLAVVLLLAAAFFFLFMYEGSSKPIEAVADQLKPNSNWQLVDNKIVAPTFTCLEANCPSVHRSWKTGKVLAKDEFQRILDNSGWNFDIADDCQASQNSGGINPLCSAEGEVKTYKISLAVWGSSDEGSGTFVLTVANK